MNPDLRTSIAFVVARDNDPWNALAHLNEHLDEDHLSQASSSVTTSVGSSPAAMFSSREPSIVTKPTSNGTDYSVYNEENEDKVDITYAASLSATYGSESEAEVEHDDALHDTLLGTGAWSSSHQAQGQCLRRRHNARIRLSKDLPHRFKKLPLVLHQHNQRGTFTHRETESITNIVPASHEEGTRSSTQHEMFKI